MNETKKPKAPLFRLIVGIAAALGLFQAGLVLFGESAPVLAVIPMFVPMSTGFAVLEFFTIGFLALGRHRALQDPVSYWTGIAFSSFFLINVFYVLSWPGLRADGQSIIGHLPGTAAWIITVGLFLFALPLIIAASARWPGEGALKGRRRFWSVVFCLILVTLINVLLIAFEKDLPALIGPEGTFTITLAVLNGIAAILFGLGAVFSTRAHLRTHDLLPGYVALYMVLQFYGLLEVILTGKRYGLMWYSSRLLVIVGGLIVLFGLLWEYIRLYRREQDKTRELEEVIVERRRVQEQLLTTLESIGDGFFACDSDWRFVYVNASAESLLGIRREDVLGKSHWEVFPLTLGTSLEREYRRAAAGEMRDFENFYEPWGR